MRTKLLIMFWAILTLSFCKAMKHSDISSSKSDSLVSSTSTNDGLVTTRLDVRGFSRTNGKICGIVSAESAPQSSGIGAKVASIALDNGLGIKGSCGLVNSSEGAATGQLLDRVADNNLSQAVCIVPQDSYMETHMDWSGVVLHGWTCSLRVKDSQVFNDPRDFPPLAKSDGLISANLSAATFLNSRNELCGVVSAVSAPQLPNSAKSPQIALDNHNGVTGFCGLINGSSDSGVADVLERVLTRNETPSVCFTLTNNVLETAIDARGAQLSGLTCSATIQSLRISSR